MAAQIGAVNTLVRQADGRLKGYNTDWSAAIEAIEACMRANPEPDCDPEGCVLDFGDSWEEAPPQAGPSGREAEEDAADSPLAGRRVVVVGAGGAGRALAFGAAARGAHVIIANRCRPLICLGLHLMSRVPQATQCTEQQHLIQVKEMPRSIVMSKAACAATPGAAAHWLKVLIGELRMLQEQATS